MHTHPELHIALAADRQGRLHEAAVAERVRLDPRRTPARYYDLLISEKRMTVTMSSAPIGRL
jgi:hypothetical protein